MTRGRRGRHGFGGAPALALLGLTGLAGLTGCGGGDDNPYGLSEFSGAAAASASMQADAPGGTPTATGARAVPQVTPRPAPSGAVTYRPADRFGQGAWVEPGRIRARGADRQAVVQAVTEYFRQRVRISNTWQIDEPALARVATGAALQGARERAATQQAAGRRSIGRFVLNLSAVRVTGDRAVVQGCPFDGTSEVNASGVVLDYPPGGVRYRLDLIRDVTGWRVTSYPTRSVGCEAP
jgi:hypothetical protein